MNTTVKTWGSDDIDFGFALSVRRECVVWEE